MPGRFLICRQLLLALALCAISPAWLKAQNIFGTVLGNVTDPSGAAVAQAEITIIHAGTNDTVRTRTDARGYFEFPYLKPGSYAIQVAAPGFKTMRRSGVAVEIDARLRLDFSLELGDMQTTVSVEETGTAVQTDSASLGRALGGRTIQQMPVLGRNVFELAGLVAGVQVNSTVAEGQVVAEGDFGSADVSVSGGRFRTNEFLIDGVTVMLPANNFPGLTPTPEATEEFKVMTGTSGAQFGRTGGGVFNIVTRGGGNEFHGAAFYFARNQALNANTFFGNARGLRPSDFSYHMLGATAGGPVLRNRTFFFAEYQGMRRQTQLGEGTRTLPTEQQRRGDFSATRTAANAPVQLFDPFTTQSTGAGGYVRQPFPGNRIPMSRFDPVASKVLQYVPQPNRAGEGPAQLFNYVYFQQSHEATDQASLRLDHRFSDRHTFFTRLTGTVFRHNNEPDFPTIAATDGERLSQPIYNAVLNATYVFSGSTFLNYRFGLTRYYRAAVPLYEDKVKLGELGFPQTIASKAQVQSFPQMAFTGYSGIGTPPGVYTGNDVWSWAADFTRIHGRHTVKFGTDIRVYNQTPFRPSQSAGSYTFTRAFTQGPNPLQSRLGQGDGFASFLLGYGTGFIQYNAAFAARNGYFGTFIQDDIRLGRLTLNLGLRWDYEQPRTERYDRFANFDFDRPFPVQVAGFRQLQGVLVQAGKEGYPRGQFETARRNLAPQVGLAYRLRRATAIRAAYGIFYAPRIGYPNSRNFGASGAELTTTWVSSLDGVTAYRPLSDPFPEGIFIPPANPADRLLMGQPLTVTDRGGARNNSYMQQWNLAIQQGLPGGWSVEAAYMGTRGIRLPLARNFNQVHPQYMDLKAELTRAVPNPFRGLVSSGPLAQPTVALSQLLRPFPHYQGISTFLQSEAWSQYHGLHLTLDKRFSSGFTLLASYTASKTIDNGAGRVIDVPNAGLRPPVQNQYDLRAEKTVSQQDVSQRLVLSHVFELPFGRGRRYGSHLPSAWNWVAGGWDLSGQLTLHTGFPLALNSTGNAGVYSEVLRPNNLGKSASLDGAVQGRLAKYFDTTVFAIPEPFSFGNTGRTLPDTRSPGRRNYNLAVSKSFSVSERVTALVRGEFYNLTNTPFFGFPGVQAGANDFGVISSASGARQIQLSAKIQW